MEHHTMTPLIRYPPSNNSLLSSGNTKKAIAYEPRTEAISPAINDDIINTEDSTSKSTKDEQTLLVEKLKKVEQEIIQTDAQINRLRKQKAQLEQAAICTPNDDDDQENVCDTKQLSIAKLVYHENRAKAQKAHAKIDCLGSSIKDLPIYNQPSDNAIYHYNASKFTNSFKTSLIACFKDRLRNRLKLEESVSAEYDRRMEKWLKSIEQDDSQPTKRIKDAKTREFFEKQFPELKKARESGERFSRVGQRVARSDAELDEILDGITEREDQDKKVKSYAVIPPMLEEMRSRKPKFINVNGYVEDIISEYKEYQILNTWTDEEKDIFRENYLQHPKNFGLIASLTSRKNVANCVQYYYMSKKSENYKQLLKRQQKRRTRSFVRPAQQTPAINPIETNNDTNKTNGFNSNDKFSGNNTLADASGQALSQQAKASKSSALVELPGEKLLNNDDHLESDMSQANMSCCICSCEFNETNQFRNVTRSNHQLYGIGVDALKPGMKICYSCRFRHVRHPSFDEPTLSPEPMEEEVDNDLMEMDQPVIQSNSKPVIDNDDESENRQNIPTHQTSPPREPPEQSGQNNCEPNKAQQRTCVRDIIDQAIEMSFQEPKNSDTIDTQIKVENLQPEILQLNTAVSQQHPISNILPLKPIGSNHIIPSSISTHLPIQNIGVDHQHQLQVQMQQKQHQLQMEYSIRQQQFLSQQLQQQQQHAQQQQQQIQSQQQLQTLQQQQQLQQISRQQPPQSKPFPIPGQNVNLAHPLNLCRKYNDPPVFQEPVRASQPKARPPPMAHGAKAPKSTPPRTVFENGVLNLSKQTPSNSATPLPCLSIQPDVANLASQQQHLLQMIQQQQQQQKQHHHQQQHNLQLQLKQSQQLQQFHLQRHKREIHHQQLQQEQQQHALHMQNQEHQVHLQQQQLPPIPQPHLQLHHPPPPPQVAQYQEHAHQLEREHSEQLKQLPQTDVQRDQPQPLKLPEPTVPQPSQPLQVLQPPPSQIPLPALQLKTLQQPQPQTSQLQPPPPPPPSLPQQLQQQQAQPKTELPVDHASRQSPVDDDSQAPQTKPEEKEPQGQKQESEIELQPSTPPQPTQQQESPAQETRAPSLSPARDESRSPNLTGSPTSPSEMVIDESADIQSSPTSSEQDEITK